MPTIKQIIHDTSDPLDTPLEQIAARATTPGWSMTEVSDSAFVWGRAIPFSSVPGDYLLSYNSIIFQGTGFAYDGGALPASGIITSITINYMDGKISGDTVIMPQPRLEFTGLAIDLSELGEEVLAALTGDIAPLYNYFLDLQWTYEGSTRDTGDRFKGGNQDDDISGDGGNDWLYGLGGNDILRLSNSYSIGRLFGGDGDDVLIAEGGRRNYLNGGAGADTLIGGTSGQDYADYSDASSGVTVNLANPSQNTGDASGDTFQSIEIIVGSAFGDFLTGDDKANKLIGGAGADVFVGGGGGDTFVGGPESTPDSSYLDPDTVDYSNSTSGLTVSLANPAHNTGDAQGDTFSFIENLIASNFSDVLYGTGEPNSIKGLDGDDTIKGYSWEDTLDGGNGNDRLDGGTEADTMIGGLGNDVFVVDDVGDKVTEFASEGTDSIEASVSYSLAGIHVERLYLTSSAAINGTGNSLDNVLKANSGRNMLNGAGGSDKINGAGGADLLTGGTGSDQFIYSNLSDSTVDVSGRDTILDFARGQDRINVSLIDANTKVSGDQAFTFIGGAAYSNKAGELRYGISGGQTVISGDVNGDGVTDFKIVLSGSIALGSSDFVL
ncbi:MULTISPECIES: calcium-binding protein [unclassified Rhizobium]|uniref:calcium-binding protein n=1 Tax=unclassified Rhizobium TaxID=2613769 RepID=UPI0007151705|nr:MULTISPECIES: calcium-binding protein [unclassified Rhizobium]KQS88274.1 hypothetical protein ASG42_17350 [Rhizobium sp. Leaf391]KQT03865.1 hypothetical protein ASG50_16710 [Rhizobium sp. Leaf386]KQT95673.1 hypothetical protein ASG68_13280 [Rhizobium sp. Leaf453]